jgi:hypothetical protein
VTRPGRWRRRALSLAVAAALAAPLAGGCGAASPRQGSGGRDAILSLVCNVPEASVFIDGRFLAPVSLLRGGVALPPGEHRLELRHEGYLGRFLEVKLAPAERRRIDARLFPILP